MKLIFPKSSNTKLAYVFVGKNGSIRFNKAISDILGLVSGERWVIGYDEEDAKKEFIYFFRYSSELDGDNDGVLMQSQHLNHFLIAKRVLEMTNIKFGNYYKYEKFSFDGRNGFRIKIFDFLSPIKRGKYKKQLPK